MPISFPLMLPGYPPPSDFEFTSEGGASVSASTFTRRSQVQAYPRERWTARIGYAPFGSRTAGAARAAARMRAIKAALNGKEGTILVGPETLIPVGSLANYYNLLRSPTRFGESVWSRVGSGAADPTVTPDVVTDPEGTATADQIDFPATSAGTDSQIFQYLQGYPTNAGKRITFSVWLRVASGTNTIYIYVEDAPSSPIERKFYLCNLTTTWKRFFVSHQFSLFPQYITAVGLRQFPSQSSKTIYAWGAQAEYAPTGVGEYAKTFTNYISDLSLQPEPSMNGAGQTGRALNVKGFVAGSTPLRAGDYFSIVSAATEGVYSSDFRLHMALTDVVADSFGNAVIHIFPRLRESPADGALIIYREPRGTFRQTSNDSGWDFDSRRTYGFDFDLEEAL